MSSARFVGPDFTKILADTARTVERGTTGVLVDAALEGKRIHQRFVARDSGGDSRLSGVGRAKGKAGNRRITVRFTDPDERSPSDVSTFLTFRGPLPLIATDTPGHIVSSAYLKGSGRRGTSRKGIGRVGQMQGPGLFGTTLRGDRRAVLNIPGIGYRRTARHPGTRSKGTWEDGRKAAEPVMRRTIEEGVFRLMGGDR